MKVDSARRTNVSNTKRSKGTVKSTDLAFTSVLDAELRTEQSTANLKVSTVDALSPVEVEMADSDKKHANSRAALILDRLEDIRQGLLIGAISKPGWNNKRNTGFWVESRDERYIGRNRIKGKGRISET